jgi:hypothetical protein
VINSHPENSSIDTFSLSSNKTENTTIIPNKTQKKIIGNTFKETQNTDYNNTKTSHTSPNQIQKKKTISNKIQKNVNIISPNEAQEAITHNKSFNLIFT